MRLLSHVAFAACLLFIAQGVYVIRLNPRSPRNQAFLALCLLFAYWDFCYCFIHAAPDKEHFFFWLRLGTPAWMLVPPIALEFLLQMAGEAKRLLRGWRRLAFYAPAVLFMIRGENGKLLTRDVIPHPWGWIEVVNSESPWFLAYVLYCLGPVLFGLFRCWLWFRRTSLERERRQARIVALAGLATLSTIAGAELILPALSHFAIPSTGSTFMLIWGVGTAYAIGRYGMLELTPSIAAAHIVERMVDSLFLVDAKGYLLEVNRQAATVLDSTVSDLVGKELAPLLRPSEVVRQDLQKVSQGRATSGEWEVETESPSGDPIPLRLAWSAVRDRSGDLVGTVVIGRDLRETRRLQQEIQERKKAVLETERIQEQLLQAQKMEAIGRLAGGIAHDFNNQLTGILAYAQLVQESLSDRPEVRADVQEILDGGDRAKRLTAQLLAFGRKQIISPRGLDLNDLLASTARMLSSILGEQVEIRLNLSSESVLVYADPVQLEQVVVNLAVNARDAMPAGGELTILTKRVILDAESCCSHGDLTPGDYVLLEVADTGIGMSAETQSQLFEPYFTTKERGKGTGLGLATVYGIVRQHRGSISVKSEVGQGSIFRVYLPSAEEIAAVAQTRSSQPVGGKETVLLVEDEPKVRSVARRVLEGAGYRVMEACCASEALETAAECNHVIDLLVSDVVMPGASGRQLAQELVCLRPGLRVLLMSGYSEDLIRAPTQQGHSEAFLQKPFTGKQLLAAVQQVLRAPSSLFQDRKDS